MQGIYHTIFYTFYVAIGSTLVALVIGLPISFFIARRKFALRKLILSFAAIPLAVPALIIALGYVNAFGMNGIVNRALMSLFNLQEPPLTFLYSPLGVIITQGFYNFPLVAVIVSDGWTKLPVTQQEAARVLGANERQVFFHITLPDLAPSIAASIIPIFLYCFSSFLIVLLFGTLGGATLEVEIYQAAKNTLDFQRATILAIVETSCSLGAVFIYSVIMRRFSDNKGIDFPSHSSISKIGHAPFMTERAKLFERISFAILMTLIFAFFILPIFGIVTAGDNDASSAAKGFETFKTAFSSKHFSQSILRTFRIAPFSALLSSSIGFIVACLLRTFDPDEKNALLQTLPFLPMAISSVVLGYAIMFLKIPRTSLTLVIAEAMLSWPIAFRYIYSALSKIPEEIIDVTKIFSYSRFDLISHVFLPLCRTAILTSLGFTFAISIGDTTLPLFLAMPNINTLALHTYRLASHYRYAQACACATIMFAIYVVIFTIIKRVEKIFDE